jgi:diguanylate cyclase (GGDEF)-like protein/PAS domain S-box-containing protein
MKVDSLPAKDHAERDARVHEERFRATFEQAAVGMAHTTVDGQFLEVNHKLCEILGYPKAELLALTTRAITYPEDRGSHRNFKRALLSGTNSFFSGHRRYVRKSGEVVWLNRTVTLARHPGSGEPYLIQVIEDISERKRVEMSLRRLIRARQVIAECNHALVHAASESGLLQEICRILVDSGGYCQAWVGLAENDADKSIRVAAAAGIEPGHLDAPKTWADGGGNRSVMGHVIATGKAHTSQNMLTEDRFLFRRERAIKRGYQSAITLPLNIENRCVGGLSIYAFEPDAFDSDEIELVNELAADIAYGIGSFRARAAREQAEASARENEQRFRETFNQAAVGIVHTAPLPDRRYLMVNQKFCDMVGYSAEELKSMTGLQLTHPDDLETDRDLERRLIEGEIGTYVSPKRYIRKDGGILWTNRTVSLVRDAGGQPVYFIRVIEDISGRRELEERFRATFDQAAVGMFQVNLERRYIQVNQKFADMLGYSRGELIGMRAVELSHPDDRAEMLRNQERMLREHVASISGEKRYLHKRGHVVWVKRTISVAQNDAGEPQYFIGVIEDITGSKESEEALRMSEERFRTVFSKANVGITLTALDMRFLQVNDKYCEMVGYERDELLRMSITDIVPPENVVESLANRRKLVSGEISSYHVDRQLLRKDGTSVWASLVVSIVRNSSGEPSYFVAVIHDLSERKRAEFALRESEEKFNQLSNNIPQVFWISDASHRQTIYISPACEQMLGFSADQLKENPLRLIRSVHSGDRLRVYKARKAAAFRQYDETYRIVRQDGAIRWIRDRAFPVRDAANQVYRIAGIAEDITERKEAEEKLVHMAHFDGLTGLPNRVLFHDRLGQLLAQAQRRGRMVAVMFLDLDRFKVANDTLGHGIGDLLLKQVAERLSECVRVGDTVGRMSGDEFSIILCDLHSAEDARLAAQKILGVFAAPFMLEHHEVYVTASIGISMYPADSDDGDALIKDADTAMYRAKDSGRNNFQFFTREMNSRAMHRLDLENSLRRALERREFLVYYQPKANLESGEITGFEALLRWRRPDHGLVLPGEFVPLLEETGMIVPVGEWIVGAVCAQLKAWAAAGCRALPVAINLSARQFAAKDLGITAKRILEEYGVDPRLIEMEITESSLMANTGEAEQTLEYLNALGVRLTIDDFGTGYSSLSYLKRFPLDALKIDRSFIRDITFDIDDATITRAVISMAHNLGLKVVAEGVETEAQLAFLAANGCDEMQGFFFSQPLPAAVCTELLRETWRLNLPARPGA